MQYELKRSDRKSVAVEVRRDGSICVRAPRWLAQREIDRFVAAHREWITAKLAGQAAYRAAHPEPNEAEAAELRRRASEILPKLAAQWSERMGVRPAGVRITSAEKRYGSCSGKNSLCFSWRLMQFPPEAIEAVVVHELAHIRHKNHSAAFYAEVEKYLPDYRRRIELLK